MQNIFTDFCSRLTRTPIRSQRPSSAHPSKLSPKHARSDYSSLKTTKKSVSQKNEGSHIGIKLTHRDWPRSEFKKSIQSAMNLDSTSTKKYRLQVINPHCIKKVVVQAPGLLSSLVGKKKQVLGEGLVGYHETRKKEFLGKRLHCLKGMNTNRLKTEHQDIEGHVSIQGIRMF